MAYLEKRLVAGSLLTASAATYYTVPAQARTIVKEMTLVNTSSTTTHTFTVYIVPSGGSAGDANTEFKTVTLQPLETRIFARTCVMEPSSTMQALADTVSVVSFSVSGVERT